MWQQLVKTFFVGQVACEQAVDAIKKQTSTLGETREELKHKAENFKTEKLNLDNFKAEKLFTKCESDLKENVAGLRKGFRSFDRACDSLKDLLTETAEIKEKLADKDAASEELVGA